MWYIFIVILVLIFINAFFAGAEMALVSISKKDLKRIKEEGHKQSKNLERILEDSTQYLSTIQVAITLAGFLSSAIAGSNLADDFKNALASINLSISEGFAMVIITFILSYITLVLGELVPKRIALNNAKKFALISAPVIYAVMIVTKPFVYLLSISTKLVLRVLRIKKQSQKEKVTERDLKEMIISGHMQGLYSKEEKSMMERILRFDDLTCEMIMTPKEDVIAINIKDDIADVIQKIRTFNYSRIPVYKENINHIEGVLVVKDIIFKDPSEVNLNDYIRKPVEIDKHMIINKAFSYMRKNNAHIGFIFEKKDKLMGIITLEDIIEEIFGNIYDEHDDMSTQTSPFTYFVDGQITLHELSDKIGIDYPKEDQQMTLSDYLLDHEIEVKNRGKITIGNIEYVILSHRKQQIKRVQIHLKG